MAIRYEIGPFLALDADAYPDGAFLDAGAARGAVRNLNAVAAKHAPCLVNAVWDLVPTDTTETGNTKRTTYGAPETWETIAAWPVVVPPGFRAAEWTVWAKITNAKNVRLQLVTFGSPFVPYSGDAAVQTLVGDGTFKRYPANGYYSANINPREGGVELLALVAYCDDNGAINDKNGNSAGPLLLRTSTDIKCGTADFDNFTPAFEDVYVGTKNADGDTTYIAPLRRIRSATLDGTSVWARIDMPGWSQPNSPDEKRWALRTPAKIQMGNVSVYAKALTAWPPTS